ncbi:MAG: recombination mediator RecR [Candidatus Spechtbacterales bacterium]|nr:recombination mediator RecR [Candidatus Spechtbacterales bacterium]
MLPKNLEQLQKQFQRFPGIGPRQARRFVFHLLKEDPENVRRLAEYLKDMQTEVVLCNDCYLPTENVKSSKCSVCTDEKRDHLSLCIVEKESDALNLEKTKIHNGKYLIIGENISPLKKSVIPKKRLSSLVKRVENSKDKYEIILALNNTREGNFTTLYIQELFKKKDLPNVKLTRLGRGLSTGSELEYADEETIRNALENRS